MDTYRQAQADMLADYISRALSVEGELSNVEPKDKPDIAEFTPKALAAFRPLAQRAQFRQLRAQARQDQPHRQPTSARHALHVRAQRQADQQDHGRLRRRLAEAGKAPKVILVAVARKLLIYAHAVVRTQKPFQPFPDAPSPI